ncbi:MAG: hypothetical protein AABZ06_15330 [Bdellovibrionota bacterium]
MKYTKLCGLWFIWLAVIASHASAVFNPSDFVDVIQDTSQASYLKYLNKNITLIDWNSPIRSQGAVGSCQSFAFLGMIENELFHEQGVSLDLSERYQLYSNFMQFGDMGAQVTHIRQFPVSFERLGSDP